MFWDPIKNRVSPRSVLLKAVYLEALLYKHLKEAAQYSHLGKKGLVSGTPKFSIQFRMYFHPTKKWKLKQITHVLNHDLTFYRSHNLLWMPEDKVTFKKGLILVWCRFSTSWKKKEKIRRRKRQRGVSTHRLEKTDNPHWTKCVQFYMAHYWKENKGLWCL